MQQKRFQLATERARRTAAQHNAPPITGWQSELKTSVQPTTTTTTSENEIESEDEQYLQSIIHRWGWDADPKRFEVCIGILEFLIHDGYSVDDTWREWILAGGNRTSDAGVIQDIARGVRYVWERRSRHTPNLSVPYRRPQDERSQLPLIRGRTARQPVAFEGSRVAMLS